MCFLPFRLPAQSDTGELRVEVEDPTGLPLAGSVQLICVLAQVNESGPTDPLGRFTRHDLPFGTYVVRVTHTGFAVYAQKVQIASRVPVQLRAMLAIQATETEVQVSTSQTLIDPESTGTVSRVGRALLQNWQASPPARSVINIVGAQPGWVQESNGTLHPRGSENQVQYIVDGIPLTENRSPTYSAGISSNDVQSLAVLTEDFPAEYGRKLGGVVELDSESDITAGLHGEFSASTASFGSRGGQASIGYGWRSSALTLSADGDMTDRYLDPPVLQNFTNHGSTSGEQVRYERQFSPSDRATFSASRDQFDFDVPNDAVQQAAGQKQARSTSETFGTATYEHLISGDALADVRVMFREVSAGLTSNANSTPIFASQQRSFREAYGKSTISLHRGMHNVKAGVETDYSPLRERFAYKITNPSFFDPSTPAAFAFDGRGIDREQAGFVQDTIHVGQWSASAGLRYDNYALLVHRSAWSPRLGIGWYWPRASLNLHASYDRVFQTPASENILLSSSPAVSALNSQVLRLPVQPSTGDYWAVGMGKALFGTAKLNVDWYRRSFTNYADDDMLFNTGVNFPIAFRQGRIYGAEAKLELPRWRRLSGLASYSYMVGFAYTPVTGGLFLGNDVGTALLNLGRFPVTQDQRNTFSGRMVVQVTRRLWTAAGAAYGSGLPTEFDGSYADAVQQHGQAIADRVDFARGRLRPFLSVNASCGADLYKHDLATVRLQGDVENLNNRLNLINFAGLFSGTGIAAPRSYALRLVSTF